MGGGEVPQGQEEGGTGRGQGSPAEGREEKKEEKRIWRKEQGQEEGG